MFHPHSRKIEIPRSVSHIGPSCFEGNHYMIELNIPDSVRVIEDSAFKDCINLEKVRFFGESPISVIPQSCFSGCTSLKEFQIQEEVAIIKANAFRGCVALSHLFIPKGVCSIEAGAFDGWNSNQTIETERTFRFGIVCKAKIMSLSAELETDTSEQVFEYCPGQFMYAVLCKCGHVGRDRYMPIWFPVIASSKREAAEIAREIPRVKHGHKDAIQELKQICLNEYLDLERRNREDPYLHAKSKYQLSNQKEEIMKRTLPETESRFY